MIDPGATIDTVTAPDIFVMRNVAAKGINSEN